MLLNFYDSSSIKVLKGLEAVRKRPGMYIGDVSDDSGLHHMIFEIIDNSIDEFLSGFCKNIIVILHKDYSVSILDDGRGIPVDIHKETGLSCVELVMTVLHSGGKFDNDSYSISGGLHGVGISVVNALSKKLELKIYRNNKIFYQTYYFGKPKNKISIIGNTNKNGTYIRFWPDKSIFINFSRFKYEIIFNRLNELSYLNNGLKIKLLSLLDRKKKIFFNNGGIKSFLISLVNNKIVINKNIFYLKKKKNNFDLEFTCQWVNTFKNNILCYTNNIFQSDGGTHLSGLKLAITRTINLFLNKECKKKYSCNIIGDDTREGLYAILSIKMPNPKFSSQIKNKLISYEIKSLVESFISDSLYNFLLENPIDSKNIINKIIISCKNRESSRKIKDLYKKKNKYDLSSFASKLADCQQKDPKLNEIFLVEGDSAGGSAKQSRNRFNQAVLPLKGKVINVEKNNLNKILSSEEINILISVLGCGINCRNFNIKKLRYNNIIIMTDADVDGSHIRTLLLTFFYRYMPDLINNGHLYIARPPLYKIKYLNNEYYISNEYDLIRYKIYFCFKNICLYKKKNNLLLLNNFNLIKLVIKYLNILNLIYKKETKFSVYILNSLMFFKKINILNYENCKLWIKNFSFYLNNNNIFFKKKIICKVFKNKFNKFFKFKFKFLDFYSSECIYIKKKFFKKYYSLLLNLGKKLYFFNKEYEKYILINNNKKYFYNFYNLINYVINYNLKYIFIQRYKGLGEMNPDQLWNTTMNPKNRYLSKIYIKDAVKADKLFKILMGDDIKSRKIFIKNNIIYDKKNIYI